MESCLAQKHDVSLKCSPGCDEVDCLLVHSAVPDDAENIGNEPDDWKLLFILNVEVEEDDLTGCNIGNDTTEEI